MGGRWNHPLTPCVYTSESRALAILEYSVNSQSGNMPHDLVMMTIEVDTEEIMELITEKLPQDWRAYPHPNSTKDIGNSILNETDVQVFAVPSVVVPREYNYVLNPANMLHGEAVVVDVEPIILDGRIKQ